MSGNRYLEDQQVEQKLVGENGIKGDFENYKNKLLDRMFPVSG